MNDGTSTMHAFWIVLAAVLPVFAIAGVGLTLRKANWLTAEADQSLLRVSINVLTPCFIFDHLVGNQALNQLGNLVAAPLVGFGVVALGLGAGWLARGVAGLRAPAEARTFAFCVGIFNYGFVPLPLALSLFDRETAGVLIVHNLGVETAFWTLGMLTLAPQTGSEPLWKKIINPPLFAIVLALAVNFLGWQEQVPGVVRTVARMLGECMIPLGLLLIGAIIADFLHDFHSESGGRAMAVACALRLGLLPVLFLLLARFLPCSVELKRVIVLQAAMPSAVYCILMARHYGGDPPTSLRVVLATSAVSLLTIPLWIQAGMKFVGL